MKKIIALLIVGIIATSFLFAEASTASWSDAFKNSNPFLYSREYEIEHALFGNPAELAGRKFQISIPVSASIYNVAKLLSYYKSGSSLESIAVQMVENIGCGEERLGTVTAGIFTGFNGFAFGVYANLDLKTNKESGQTTLETELSPMACVGIAFGHGSRLFEINNVTFDAGATLHVDASVVLDPTTANEVLFNESGNIEFNTEKIKKVLNKKISSSTFIKCLGLTMDLGADVGFLNKTIVFKGAVTDIPLYYTNFNWSSKSFEKVSDADAKKTLINRWDLQFGLMLQHKFGPLDLALSADYFNIVHADYSNYTAKTVLAHTNLRLTADIWNFIKGSAALNAGDLEFDLGLNLSGNELDVVYKVMEFGSKPIGDSTVDSLTVRMRIGFDSNSRIGR